jgi:excinuclease ABC subunit A
VATYLGFFDQVRAALAATPTAKAAGLTAGSFSFNSEGGRCETCRGLGRVVEDLSFLGEMEVICPTCRGRRFIEKVLQVEYRGKNVNDILRLTLDEAREFFFDRPAVVKALDTLIGMGLGYITVGQSTSSFSGGEAQRLKLAHLLLDMKALGRSVLIFDEPTTGLSDRDVSRLVAQLQALASAGHTIIVVEHHLGMIRSADWLIELGPGSAHMGGTIVYEGPPSGLKSSPSSPTAAWID